MRKENDSIDAFVVNYPQGLEIIIECVANQYGVGSNEGI